MKTKKMAVTGQRLTHAENQSVVNFAERIPVSISNIGNKDIQSVSGRKLHVFLKVGRDFTNWIKGRIDQYGFVAGADYIRVENLSSPKRASAKSRQQISPGIRRANQSRATDC